MTSENSFGLRVWRGFLNWIGIVPIVSSERSGRWRFQFRKRFFVFAGLAILLSAAGGVTSYSTSPSFCYSCHIMEPYYNAWASSKHNGVACVQCHYPPGEPQEILWKKFQALSQVVKYVTQTYSSKPFAEVEDASCLRSGCHSTKLLEGKLLTSRKLHFDHKTHLGKIDGGKELRCVSCHTQIVVGKHMEMNWSSCLLCHLKGQQDGRDIAPAGGCLGCHEMPSREIQAGNIAYSHKDFLGQHSVACQSCHQDVIQGSGRAERDRCLSCHNQTEKLDRYLDTAFVHESHIKKHAISCNQCHQEIRHGVAAAGTKTLNYDCTVCHTDMHDIQRDFYRGLGAKQVASMPSPMYLANVDCVGCHLAKKNGNGGVGHAETYIGSEKGCTDCHGKEYLGILPEAQGLVKETGQKLDEKLKGLQKILSEKKPGGPLPAESLQALEDAAYNLKLLAAASSAHNIYYAAQILRTTDGVLNDVAERAQVTAEDTSELPVISGAFCATLCHSKLGVKVPPETVVFEKKVMPHKEHVDQGMACVQCHEFGAHKDVRLKSPASCQLCHEEEEEGGKEDAKK